MMNKARAVVYETTRTNSLILRVLLLGSLLPTSPARVFAQTLVERLDSLPAQSSSLSMRTIWAKPTR